MISSRNGNVRPSQVQSGSSNDSVTRNELKWLQSVRIGIYYNDLGSRNFGKGITLSNGHERYLSSNKVVVF